MKLKFVMVRWFLIVALLITLAGYVSVVFTERTLERYVVGDVEQFVSSVIDDVDRVMNRRIEQASLFIADPVIRDFLISSNAELSAAGSVDDVLAERDEWWVSNPSKSLSLVRSVLDNSVSDALTSQKHYYDSQYDYPVVGEYFITNKYGAVVAMTRKTSDYRQDDELWWQKSRDSGLFIEDVDFDESADAYTVDIGLRIDDLDGNFLGVLKFALRVEEAEDILNSAASRIKGTMLSLVRSDGAIIYSTAPFERFRQFSFGSFHSGVDWSDRVSDVSYSLENGNLVIHSHSNSFGIYPGLNWSVVGVSQVSWIFSAVEQLRFALVGLFVFLVLFSLAVGLYVSRKISSPITHLNNSVMALSKGNFDVKLPHSDISEITELMNSFKRILTSLKLAVYKVGLRKEEILAEGLEVIKEEKAAVEKKLEIASNLPDENPSPILRVSVDGKIDYSNSASSGLLSLWKVKDSVPKNIKSVVDSVLSSGKTVFNEVILGSSIIRLSFVPLKDKNCVNIYGSDVTKIYDAQRILEVFKKGFETSPNSMAIVDYKDKEPHFVHVNKAFTKIYGYSEDEVRGKNPRILKSGKQSVQHYKGLYGDLLNPKIGHFTSEMINKRKDGRLIYVVFSASTIFDESGKPKYFLANHADITSRVLAEQKLRDILAKKK